MTDPLTIIAVDEAPNLAVDVLPDNVPGTFLVDVSEVDGYDLLGWGADGWLNVVCDVREVHIARGMTRLQGPLTRTEAGSATVVIEDLARRFDPMVNADAVHPGVRIRVRAWGGTDPAAPAWTAVLFTGRIGSDFAVTYQQLGAPIVSLTAIDVIGPLALFDAFGRPDPGIGAGDNLRGRVTRVLAEVGLSPATLATDSDVGYVATLTSSTLDGGWDDVNRAADAELGRVWINAADQIVTRARGSELTGPVRGTLSDWHGETVDEDADEVHCCYTDPVVRFGTDSLTNRAVAARRVPSVAGTTVSPSALVQVDDTYSQARWTNNVPVAHRDTSLELETDGQLRPWAEWLVLAAAEPELRVDSVTPRPPDDAAWRAACSTDIGDRWAFRLHPELGATVASTLGVVGISHEITPDGWSITWATVRAPTPGEGNPSGWFTVDVSQVDGPDVLPPFGGSVPA